MMKDIGVVRFICYFLLSWEPTSMKDLLKWELTIYVRNRALWPMPIHTSGLRRDSGWRYGYSSLRQQWPQGAG